MQHTHGITLLSEEDGDAFSVHNSSGTSEILLICEHASNVIPQRLGDMGLDENTRESHIAWDPGALLVAKELSRLFDATLISANFSRLVYDCNRPPESKASMPEKSEIYLVPGNRNLDDSERNARIESIYLPFKQEISQIVANRIKAGRRPILVTIHSFTPVYNDKQRDVELGVLHDEDTTLADGILNAAQSLSKLDARRNQPYGPQDGVTHTLRVHALPDKLLNVMIEIRNSLIQTKEQQQQMASELAILINAALEEIGLTSDATANTAEVKNA